jgi:methylated-DNA-protein-cysteine methyltransferase-like protein
MRDALYELVRRIPSGRATSYGALGRALDPPISGYLVGRAMGACPPDVPWWRVVARDGSLPVNKRSPELAEEQRAHLEREGVSLDGLRVHPGAMLSADELLAL